MVVCPWRVPCVPSPKFREYADEDKNLDWNVIYVMLPSVVRSEGEILSWLALTLREERSSMNIVITEWALQTYLALFHRRVFTAEDYNDILRPDTLLLHDYPNNQRFQVRNFWGPAQNGDGGCFKMKWHNLGPSHVQLRLGVYIDSDEAFLCEGYVKSSIPIDKRYAARLKVHAGLIRKGQYKRMGYLT